MVRSLRVAVIGAGLGGLAAACALRRRGIEAVLYERASQLGEVGAGIQLGPNAVKVLRALGIEQPLLPLASEPASYASLAWNDGRLRYREPMKGPYAAQFGAPYLMTHRADLHRQFCNQLPDSAVHLGMRCTGVANRNGAAVATFDGGAEIEADVIIGADGINSTVRERLFGLQPARFTQQMAWRCIVPIECAPTRVGPGNAVEVGRDDPVRSDPRGQRHRAEPRLVERVGGAHERRDPLVGPGFFGLRPLRRHGRRPHRRHPHGLAPQLHLGRGEMRGDAFDVRAARLFGVELDEARGIVDLAPRL